MATLPCPVETKLYLQWVAQSVPIYTKLSFNILSEVSSYLCVSGLLLGIHGATLRCYDFQGGELTTVNLTHSFTDGTSYCPLDSNTVLCIGAWPESTEVFLMQRPDYQLVQMQSMHMARGYSGVVRHRAFVYVFGGYDAHAVMKSCEKFSLVKKGWSPLPDMGHRRYCFTPCLYESNVFLADAYIGGSVLETFNVGTEVFTALPVTLEGLSGNSIAFIDTGELIIVTHSEEVGKWRINSAETRFRVEEVNNEANVVPDSSFPPVKIGKEVFYVRYNTGVLHVFNMETRTLMAR